MEATAGADLDTTLASHWSKAITWPEYWPLICLEYTTSLALAWHDIPALPGSLQMTAVVISWVLGDDEISTIVCLWFNGSWHMHDSLSLIWHDNYLSTVCSLSSVLMTWHHETASLTQGLLCLAAHIALWDTRLTRQYVLIWTYLLSSANLKAFKCWPGV